MHLRINIVHFLGDTRASLCVCVCVCTREVPGFPWRKGRVAAERGWSGRKRAARREQEENQVHPVKRHAENSASRCPRQEYRAFHLRFPPVQAGASLLQAPPTTLLATSLRPTTSRASRWFPLVPSYRRVGTTDGGRLYFIILLTYWYRPRCMRLSSGHLVSLSLSLSLFLSFFLSVGCNVAALRHCSLQRPRPTPLPHLSFFAERKYNTFFPPSSGGNVSRTSSVPRCTAVHPLLFEFRHFFTRLEPPRCSSPAKYACY